MMHGPINIRFICIESIMGCGMQVISYNNAPSPSPPSPSDWLRQFWAKPLPL